MAKVRVDYVEIDDRDCETWKIITVIIIIIWCLVVNFIYNIYGNINGVHFVIQRHCTIQYNTNTTTDISIHFSFFFHFVLLHFWIPSLEVVPLFLILFLSNFVKEILNFQMKTKTKQWRIFLDVIRLYRLY